MILFQIADPVVDNLDLFLHHRHSLCKTVVLPDFTGQFFHLRFHNSLGNLLTLLTLLRGGSASNYDSNQRQATSDQCYHNSFTHYHTPYNRVLGGALPSEYPTISTADCKVYCTILCRDSPSRDLCPSMAVHAEARTGSVLSCRECPWHTMQSCLCPATLS